MEIVGIVIGVIILGSVLGAAIHWHVIRLRYEQPPRSKEIYRITTDDGWTIRVCRYRDRENTGEPVVLCHGIVGNQWAFTAPEGDSFVDTLSAAGYDCWVVDVRGTRSSTPPDGGTRYDARAEDYSLQDMPAVIDRIETETGHPKVHWIGHSMGGLMLYMYLTAIGGERIASGTTIGSPPGLSHLKLPPTQVLAFFVGLTPKLVEFALRSGSIYFERFKIDNPLLPINWQNVDRRVDARVFFNLTEFLPYPVTHQLQQWICTKRWVVGEQQQNVEAAVERYDAPLNLMYGTIDPFTPMPVARSWYEKVPGTDKQLVFLGKEHGCEHDYSHIDEIYSPNGAEEVHAPIIEWMKKHPVSAPQRRTSRSRTKPTDTTAGAARKSKTKKRTTKKKTVSRKNSAGKKATAKKKASKKSNSRKPARSEPKSKVSSKKRASKTTRKKKPATRRK